MLVDAAAISQLHRRGHHAARLSAGQSVSFAGRANERSLIVAGESPQTFANSFTAKSHVISSCHARPLLAALLLLLAPAHAAKQETSALINLANDYASALKPAELNALETQLVEISRSNAYQIAVAIYPQLPPGAERDNATELADKLLVGSAVDNRGLVIFVFLAEKVVRVEVGYGLEGLVPDATAHRIAEKIAARIAKGEMAPALRDAIADLTPVLQSLQRIDRSGNRHSGNGFPISCSPRPTRRAASFFMRPTIANSRSSSHRGGDPTMRKAARC